MYCRKDFIDLTSEERDRLAAAFNQIYDDGVIEEHAHHHEHYFSNGIHRGPAFLPWHRHMLLLVEQALRAVDGRVSLPYWDWTRGDSRDLDAEPWKSFFGGRNNSGGKFDHWDYTRGSASGSLPSLDSVIDELRAGTFADFRAMEFGSHVPGHTWTGGTMNSTRSPADPLFYLHHGNVDRLWAIWQRNHAGEDQYTLDDCSGCLKIPSTFVPLNDPMVGGATPASMLNHIALGYFYHRDPALEARVVERSLPPMISGDATAFTLVTPQIVFNDVPEGDTTQRAAFFQIAGCENVSFHVTSAPTAPFSLASPGPFPHPAGPFPTEELRIWVMYTGRTPGSTDTGTISIAAQNEFGDELQRWDSIPILANSVARPKVAVALVLDESGSMLADAGNNRTRLQVLQLAATTFIDQLYDDNGIAMVAFDETAEQLADLQVAGDLASGVRTAARTAIGSHGPPDVYQHTSIGAGLQAAANLYAASPVAGDFDIKATVVFTDGFEDRAPLIADVQSLINERVYAVGVGDAANVRNDILRALADDTGGTMLVTGAIAQDDEFLLEKFFIQILAGVTNRDIVRDPPGWIVPGQVARVPFSITRSDIAFDAVALSRAPHFFAMALETPNGTFVPDGQVPAGAFRQGATSKNFRIQLPLVVDGKEHWEGEWELLLAMRAIGHDVAGVPLKSSAFASSVALPFHALVHARSNLRMRASLSQSALTPGAEIHLRAVITEYGQPITTHPAVMAVVTRPDHTVGSLNFVESSAGEFEASLIASQAGVYRFHIHSSGLSGRGHAFTREQLLTAVVGRIPEQPGVPAEPDRGKLCDFLTCLLSDGRFYKQLEAWGIDPARLRECLRKVCAR